MTDQNKVSGKIINYNSSYIGDLYFNEKISDLKIKDSDDYNNIIIPGFIAVSYTHLTLPTKA